MGYDNLEQIDMKYKKEKRRFFERNNNFKKFENIDEERMNEIRNNAMNWLENCSKNPTIRMALCLFTNLNDHRINQRIPTLTPQRANALFDFDSNDEEVMFYMFVMDPELKLLQIKYEESDTENIKRRYFEEFGITLDNRLLKIELIYNKKFPVMEEEAVLTRQNK